MLRQPQSGARNLTRRAPPRLGSTSPSPIPRRLAPSRTPCQPKLNTSGRKLNTFPPELNTSATKPNTCSPSPPVWPPAGVPLDRRNHLVYTRPIVPYPSCRVPPHLPAAPVHPTHPIRWYASRFDPAPTRPHHSRTGPPSFPRRRKSIPSSPLVSAPHPFAVSPENPPQTVSRQPDPHRGSGWRETVPPFTPTPAAGPAGAAQRTPICSRTVVGKPKVLTHG